jgi:hypothetical protein
MKRCIVWSRPAKAVGSSSQRVHTHKPHA